MITGGVIAYPFSEAWDVLRHFRDVTASLPDDLMVFGGLIHAPDGSGAKLVAMVVCHCGSLADGEVAVQPIKSFGTPAMDALGPLPYTTMNSMLDGGYPRGALNYWKSNFLASLSDEAIRTMIDCFAQCPSPMGQLLLEHFHGAITRVGVTDTAFPLRAEGYNPHPSPHSARARNLPNSPLPTSISANRCISGSSRCSGMFGISS
jgi:hypothetical protein